MIIVSYNHARDGSFVNSASFAGLNTTSPTGKFHSIGTANITQEMASFAVNSDRNIVIHLE